MPALEMPLEAADLFGDLPDARDGDRRRRGEPTGLCPRRADRGRHRRLPRTARGQGPAALHHLRLGGRRQVDADRPPALRFARAIFADQLEALEADSRRMGTQGAEDRLRAAGRRPVGGARAGHHHRRRLSLLRHRRPQVHRRRHAGARAVHPQHGHRRFDRRLRGDPGRCAQGRADADTAAQLPRPPPRRAPHRAGGEQDGPGRPRPHRLRPHPPGLPGLRQLDRHHRLPRDPVVGADRRERRDACRDDDAMVRRPDAAGAAGAGAGGRCGGGGAVPHAGAARRPPRPRLSAASPAPIAGGSVRPGDAVRILPSGRTTRIARIVTADGDLAEAVGRHLADAHLRRRGGLRARRRDRRPPPPRRRSPTGWRRRWCGWPTRRCCPAAAI